MIWGDTWGWFWGDDSPLPEHVALGTARVFEQLKNRPNFLALLDVTLSELNAIEKAIEDVKYFRHLATAQGEQLNRIGANWNVPRYGYGDAVYRLLIYARVRAYIGSGTTEDILAVLRILAQGRLYGLIEYPRAAFIGFIAGATPTEGAIFSAISTGLAGAGIGGGLITYEAGATLSFDNAAAPGIEMSGWFSNVSSSDPAGTGWASAFQIFGS